MSPFVRRLRLRNYKSIAQCDVELGAFTLLVGRNGAGKSNFLDAMRFVVDGLSSSLDHAIKSRGGIEAVRRRSTGHPHNFAVELDLEIDDAHFALYGFEIAAQKSGGFSVKKEQLEVRSGSNARLAHYLVEDGQLRQSSGSLPQVLADRLYLVNVSGLPDFRPVYDGLISMGFYNLSPEAIKELQTPDAGELLHRDGSNLASVIARLAKERPEVMERVRNYLQSIVPGVTDVVREQLGPRETLLFRQDVEGAQHPWRFYAASMSDGTLRALGALVAVQQFATKSRRARLIGIEEPEAALHPAATGSLVDALREASTYTQVVVTTHSPELLENIDTTTETLLVVVANKGKTDIAKIDQASQESIKSHLYSPGELLRMDQLGLDYGDLQRQQQQPTLFDAVEEAK